MSTLKKNFSFNLILTLCNYIFPLLIYPYVSRVLGVENIGICNFVDSIINYFIIFSMLGVGSYGVREIARCKDNIDKRNEVFSNLFIINTIMTIMSIIVLLLSTFLIPQMAAYKDFLGVGLIKVLFNLFLIEWFFQGVQQFKYITIRSVIVRCLYVLSVFLFVRTQHDTLIYYMLTSLIIVINSIFNWSYSRRFKKFCFKYINVGLYIRPILVFGYYRILTSMYTTFNTTFLGFSCGDMEVGYFSTATKLYSIIMAVFTAFTTVMVPHVSQLLQEGNKEKVQRILNKTISVLIFISIPIIIVCELFAPWIIYLIAGPSYEGAIIPFRIVICLLLIIGLEQIIIQQFLMASNSNKSIFHVSTCGAIVALVLNFFITPQLGAIGSSIAWGCSEVAVLITGIYLIKAHMGLNIDIRNILFIHIPISLVRWKKK